MHFVSKSCGGEKCRICGEDATHKVGEVMLWDDPTRGQRHEFTAYVCCDCFLMIMGPAVPCKKTHEMSFHDFEKVTPGTKVRYLPDGTIYDFGYLGGTGLIICYVEGECNMQDSVAIEPGKLELV